MRYLLVLFLISFSLVLRGQEYKMPPLFHLAIEKSLNDVDFFRMTMLDNNFEHDSEETEEQNDDDIVIEDLGSELSEESYDYESDDK